MKRSSWELQAALCSWEHLVRRSVLTYAVSSVDLQESLKVKVQNRKEEIVVRPRH